MRILLKDKLEIYIITYIIGYIISILNTGVVNNYYFIPIKIIPITFALCAGNAVYYTFQGYSHYAVGFKSIKYICISILILGLSASLHNYMLVNYNIDITPFIGMDAN